MSWSALPWFALVFLSSTLAHARPDASAPAAEEGSPRAPAASPTTWSGPSGYAMVAIAPGVIALPPPSEPKDPSDDPTHLVKLARGFYLGQTEVTRGLWRAVMGSDPSDPGADEPGSPSDVLPVQNLSWCDAARFANQLSERDGLAPVYRGLQWCEDAYETGRVQWRPERNGYRLPTEAEWVYAANAGQRMATKLWAPEDAPCPGERAPEGGCVGQETAIAAVGSGTANPWGLHDMAGSVAEWCWDFAGPDESSVDPTGPMSAVPVPEPAKLGAVCGTPEVDDPFARRDTEATEAASGLVPIPSTRRPAGHVGPWRMVCGRSWHADIRTTKVSTRRKLEPWQARPDTGLRLVRSME